MMVNELARRGRLEQGGELYGKALESWVFHDLSAYRAYSEEWFDLAYWRLSGGTEVDFVIGEAAVAIEVKATTKVASHHLRGLREMASDYSGLRNRILVCLEPRPRRTEAGIDVLPVGEFSRRLWEARSLRPLLDEPEEGDPNVNNDFRLALEVFVQSYPELGAIDAYSGFGASRTTYANRASPISSGIAATATISSAMV